MALNGGLITAPVSIADVKAAIGSTSNDLGTLCRSASINKWAKYKPVKSQVVNGKGKISSLTDEEFEITPSETIDGVNIQTRYGLACMSGAELISVHQCTFEYFRPTGGAAQPYRLTDYWGYNAYGTPEFLGVTHFDSTIDPNIGTLNVFLQMNYNAVGALVPSTNCVSLAKMMGHSNLSNLTSCKVCCMVSSTNDNGQPMSGTNWVICCTNTYEDEITAIKHGNSLYQSFHAPLGDGAPAGLKETGRHLVSFFLAEGSRVPAAWSSWTSVGMSEQFNGNWMAVPEAAGLEVNFQRAQDMVVINSFNLSRNTINGVARISGGLSFSFNTEHDSVNIGDRMSLGIRITAAGQTLMNNTTEYTVDAEPHIVLVIKEVTSTSGSNNATAVITLPGGFTKTVTTTIN